MTSRLSTKDRIIRTLRPFVMRSTGLTMDDATEFLTKLSEEERSTIWKLRYAPAVLKSKRARQGVPIKDRRARSAAPRVGGVGVRGTYVPRASHS
jgi:hypothetical protein